MKMELKLDSVTTDADMTAMGIPVGHFEAKGSWVADDDDVLMLVDMQATHGEGKKLPWITAVREATHDKYGHSPSRNLLADMWDYITSEIHCDRITVQRRVVYTTPECNHIYLGCDCHTPTCASPESCLGECDVCVEVGCDCYNTHAKETESMTKIK